MSAPGLFLDGTLQARRRDGGLQRIAGPLHLRARGGVWTCLLGPSGVGKSSVLQAFSGGQDGLWLDGTAGIEGGGKLALMAQDAGLLPWLSALGNVCIGARLRGETPDPARALRLLAAVGLEAQAQLGCLRLSGGQQQRLALARTLYEDRPVVLLDEPFSALDVATRARVQDRARQLLAGRTVLHVTHDPAEAARLADDILILGPHGLEPVAVPCHADRDSPQLAARLTARLMALA